MQKEIHVEASCQIFLNILWEHLCKLVCMSSNSLSLDNFIALIRRGASYDCT